MKKRWFLLVAGLLALSGSLAFVQARAGGDGQEGETAAPAEAPIGPSGQPIAFPHDRHAGEYRIDCMYCHFSAERSSAAGVPAVRTCMGCHAFVDGSVNPEEVAKLRGFFERGEAIPWRRIYKLPDHVQFPHMRHISGGVECAACHGPVEEIGVIQRVEQPLTMGWCLRCHMETGASRDCAVCHY
jgi:hypothetical protein